MSNSAIDASSFSPLIDLPEALLTPVTRYLPPQDLASLRFTCRYLRKTIDGLDHPKYGSWGKVAILRQRNMVALSPMLTTKLGITLLQQVRQLTLHLIREEPRELLQQIWGQFALHGQKLHTIRCIHEASCTKSTVALAQSLLAQERPTAHHIRLELQLSSLPKLHTFFKVIGNMPLLFDCSKIHVGPSLQWEKKYLHPSVRTHNALSTSQSAALQQGRNRSPALALRGTNYVRSCPYWQHGPLATVDSLLLESMGHVLLSSILHRQNKSLLSLTSLQLVKGSGRALLTMLGQREQLSRIPLPKLRFFNLQSNHLRGKEVLTLLDAFQCDNLKHLYLNNNSLSDTDVPLLTRAPLLAQIEILSLAYNQWSQAGLIQWLTYSSTSALLSRLDLSCHEEKTPQQQQQLYQLKVQQRGKVEILL